MENTKGKFDFDSGSLFIYVFRKMKILAIVTIAAAVISLIISYQITPKFKSAVVMFPTAGVSVSKSLLSNNYSSQKGSLMNFGEEEEAEQLLQVLNSEELKGRIIQKFDLMKHYGINPTSKYPYTKLNGEFQSNFSFHRTEFMSVIIEVMDEDPKMAADMANYAAGLIDTIMNRMQHERAVEGLQLVEKEYFTLKDNIRKIQDSLTVISNLGVNDYESQAKALNEAYAKAISNGKNSAANALQGKLNQLSKYGSINLSLTKLLKFEAEQLSLLEAKYAEARVEVEQNMSHKYIVDSAQPAEKKAYPKKLYIILASMVSAFIITLISLIILDNINKYRQ